MAQELTPGALRKVADLLDLYDRFAAAHFAFVETLNVPLPDSLPAALDWARGDEVQQDLRRWADELGAAS